MGLHGRQWIELRPALSLPAGDLRRLIGINGP
jgi:hypothetical protein